MENATHFVEVIKSGLCSKLRNSPVNKIEFLSVALQTTLYSRDFVTIAIWKIKEHPVQVMVVDEINDVRVLIVEEIK